MKKSQYIILGVLLVVSLVGFIWKDALSHLASNISSSVLISSGQREFHMQLPAGYTREMYAPHINDIILQKYPECIGANSVTLSVDGDVLAVRFDCLMAVSQDTFVTTEALPETTSISPETTFSEPTTTEISSGIPTTDIATTS